MHYPGDRLRKPNLMKVDMNTICGAGNLLRPLTASGGGKRKKLVTYMTFDDGRRIVAPTWPRSSYEGLAAMAVVSKIWVTYIESSNGINTFYNDLIDCIQAMSTTKD